MFRANCVCLSVTLANLSKVRANIRRSSVDEMSHKDKFNTDPRDSKLFFVFFWFGPNICVRATAAAAEPLGFSEGGCVTLPNYLIAANVLTLEARPTKGCHGLLA